MKLSIFLSISTVVAVGAFTPSPTTFRPRTSLSMGIFKNISDMDLFTRGSDDYGARKSKVLKVGRITKGKSYVPDGLSAGQYDKVRKSEKAKKDANYKRNVDKQGKFQNFTAWYTKRGTDKTDTWRSTTNGGHTMVKTKYDWSGAVDEAAPFTPGKKKAKLGKGKK